MLFFGGCLPVRLGFAYAASVANPVQLQTMGIAAAVVSFLLLLTWISSFSLTRKPNRGFFGGPIWWNYTRPVHALMYMLFAV